MRADGAMRDRAVPSATASRQDGGSPCGRVALRRDRRQDGGSPYMGEPIMGSRRPGGSLLKRRERRFPDAPLRTGLSPMVGGSGSVNFVSRNSSRHELNEICYNVCR